RIGAAHDPPEPRRAAAPAPRDRDDPPPAQRRSVRCGIAGPAQLPPTVRQQLVDPLGRMRADPTQYIAEVGLPVAPPALARRAQAHQDRRRLRPLVAPRE